MVCGLNKKGYSLVELLVAAGIFVVILAVVSGIFVSEIRTQNKIYNSYFLQSEGNFLMQKISKEIRMLKNINSSQEGNIDSSLEFENYNSESTAYCRSDQFGACSASGYYLARNGQVISSPEIIVESLKFYTSDSFTARQPLITVILKIKSTVTGEDLLLQNSLVIRSYN